MHVDASAGLGVQLHKSSEEEDKEQRSLKTLGHGVRTWFRGGKVQVGLEAVRQIEIVAK